MRLLLSMQTQPKSQAYLQLGVGSMSFLLEFMDTS